MSERKLTYAKAINEGLHEAMSQDGRVICFGLGVDDPKRIFGTTSGLIEKFGNRRVFDMPTAENAMTGIGIGASLNNIRPVMVHQRLDFFLLAMDQLVNNAAKWHYMFGGKRSVPITIRLILGRGWGQGPTHSQNLQSWFAHIPGLKVVMPTTAADAKGMLISSIFDENPVVFLEHRWLHNLEGHVPVGDHRESISKAKLLRQGKDITIVAMSYMTVEALHACDFLAKHGISCDLIDLRSIRPIDWETIFNSVGKTGKLLALDTGIGMCSVSSEIIARVTMDRWEKLTCAPKQLAMPEYPEATSFGLTKDLYIRSEHIVKEVANMLKMDIDTSALVKNRTQPHDVPGDWFKGPF